MKANKKRGAIMIELDSRRGLINNNNDDVDSDNSDDIDDDDDDGGDDNDDGNDIDNDGDDGNLSVDPMCVYCLVTHLMHQRQFNRPQEIFAYDMLVSN